MKKRSVGLAKQPVITPVPPNSSGHFPIPNGLPHVFIIQRPRPREDGWVPNVQAATQYGALHYIFEVEDRAWKNPEAAEVKAVRALWEFDPERDHILPLMAFGDPMCIVTVIHVLSEMFGEQPIKYLYWNRNIKGDHSIDRLNGYYHEVPIGPVKLERYERQQQPTTTTKT